MLSVPTFLVAQFGRQYVMGDDDGYNYIMTSSYNRFIRILFICLMKILKDTTKAK